LKKFKFIDLFAGIGGFHQAVAGFGGECVFASEWDDEAAKTYHQNYDIEPFGDITKIDENDIPSHDMLCGGFPLPSIFHLWETKGV
jgi:DNA (cytosine-5)-methyltransferase 1